MTVVPSKEIALATKISAFAAGDFTKDKIRTAASLAAKAASEALFLESDEEKRRTIDTAIEFLPHSDFFEQGRWDLEVIGRNANRSLVFGHPLWTLQPRHFEQRQEVLLPTDWLVEKRLSFWVEWHKAFSRGEPLDWDLQRRVALIDQQIWEAGSEAVAAEIERIRVQTALGDLTKNSRRTVADRHAIGGNNPPEVTEKEQLARSVTLIWSAAEELSTALEQEKPKREWVENILRKLKAGLEGVLRWCARQVNLTVGTVVVVGATKGASAVTDAYIAKHPEKIEALIEALERWLPFLL